MMRLNKYIASCGLCSRRKADELIENGLVFVNGQKVLELGFSVTSKDKVVVSGQILTPQKFEYYRFYKPSGYITTCDDDKGRKTIYDILPDTMRKLKPVGRLDKDSTGLIILTNDGELINELTHPSVKIPKNYYVIVSGKVNLNELQQLKKGMEIEPHKMAYADAEILEYKQKTTALSVTLYQGLNRQIRKMFDILGYPVISLKRVRHATITLEGLKRGEFKVIKPSQIRELKGFLKKAGKLNA